MKRMALAGLMLAALGCGEPSAPPPGAPDADTIHAPEIELNTNGDDAQAPASKDEDAPTDAAGGE